MSSEIQPSLEIWGVMDRMVPTVKVLIIVCCSTSEEPVLCGTTVVLVLKNGSSSPTLIKAL